MSFGIFKHSDELDQIALADQESIDTLKKLRNKIGNDALPIFLIEYIQAVSQGGTRTRLYRISDNFCLFI
jgi:hypothetical protein